ncbi:hypothetical protein AXK30_24350 [Escherichia coli]|nr:hypothetical protein AXK30_24350 [Escherichia coli]
MRSASDVAAFLGGDRPVTVVNPPAMRHPQIRIVVPVANMDDVSSVASGTGEDSHAGREGPSGHILKRVSLMKCCAIARPLSLLIHVGWRKTDGTIK